MTFEPPTTSEPVAPELWVSVRKRRFKVTYDSDRGSVELIDEKGRRVHSTVLTTGTAPLVLTNDDQLVLDRQPYAVDEDQLGMALAFVHFVNLRIPRNALQHAQYDDGLDALLQPLENMVRFQYAVVNVGMFNSADRMARAMAHALAETDLRDLLPQIEAPTLLLYGDADERSPLSIAHALHATIPGSKLAIMPGLGHECYLECAEAFDTEVRGFLVGLDV